MKRIVRAALAAALHLSLIHPASAQWQGGIGLGVRGAAHTEYDTGGRRLVRETGWLPGVTLDAAYKAGDFTWIGGADWYRGGIGYRGQTQSGIAADSTTSTGLAALRAGAAYAVGRDYSILAAFEVERWQRDIRGSGSSAGLQETYRTKRWIAGMGKAWHPAAGAVSAEAGIVLAQPERLQVGFSGLLDPVSFETRRSHGIRLGVGLRPACAPWLELRSRYDWARTPRSADATVTRNGQFAGTVAQPEHVRQALALTVAAVF
jgi:hypothetical protein